MMCEGHSAGTGWLGLVDAQLCSHDGHGMRKAMQCVNPRLSMLVAFVGGQS